MNKLAACLLPLALAAPAVSAQTSAATGSSSVSDSPSGGCGRISVFDAAPRTNDLYRARLLNIDGRLPGPTGARSFRVSTGKHVLEVAEAIDNKQFNDVQIRQRVQNADRYKTLEVDVQPNTTYMLASHLIPERRNYILDQSYWEPVIYHQSNEACQ